MKKRINLAIAKKQILRLKDERSLWAKVWLEALMSDSPNSPFFLNNYRSCEEKMRSMMEQYHLEPGFKMTWFDKILCGLFYC